MAVRCPWRCGSCRQPAVCLPPPPHPQPSPGARAPAPGTTCHPHDLESGQASGTTFPLAGVGLKDVNAPCTPRDYHCLDFLKSLKNQCKVQKNVPEESKIFLFSLHFSQSNFIERPTMCTVFRTPCAGIPLERGEVFSLGPTQLRSVAGHFDKQPHPLNFQASTAEGSPPEAGPPQTAPRCGLPAAPPPPPLLPPASQTPALSLISRTCLASSTDPPNPGASPRPRCSSCGTPTPTRVSFFFPRHVCGVTSTKVHALSALHSPLPSTLIYMRLP